MGAAGDRADLLRLGDLDLEGKALWHVRGSGVVISIGRGAVSAGDIRRYGQGSDSSAVGKVVFQESDEAKVDLDLRLLGNVAKRGRKDLGRVLL